jgi:hypothetical protein
MAFWEDVKARWREGRVYIKALITWHSSIGALALLQVVLVAFIGFFYYSTGKKAIVLETSLEVWTK